MYGRPPSPAPHINATITLDVTRKNKVTIDKILIKHFGMCTKQLRGNMILATKMRITKNMKTTYEAYNQG